MTLPFLLLQPGARQRDEAWAGDDLMEFFHLARLYKFSQSELQPTNYLKGVPGDTTLWRGPGTDIEPLADVLPSAQRPTWDAIPAEKLRVALPLQPGKFALREAEKGVPVAPGADQAQDGGAAVKKEKKSGKKRKLDAPA